MNRVLVDVCCWFIWGRSRRQFFRKKHLNKKQQNLLKLPNNICGSIVFENKNYLLIHKINFDFGIDFDPLNSYIFWFCCCGLSDSISAFALALYLYKQGKNEIIFIEQRDKKRNVHGYNFLELYELDKICKFKILPIDDFNSSGDLKRLILSDNFSNSLFDVNKNVSPPIFNRNWDDLSSFPYINDLCESLTLKLPMNKLNQECLNKIKSSNSICVHLRMGDILFERSNELLGYLPKREYFLKSMKKMVTLLGNDACFFVFSNTMELAKKRINEFQEQLNSKFEFVSINGDDEGYFDLELMKNCHHFITSGGGFSRTAYHLCLNKDKTIISPTASDMPITFEERKKDWGYRVGNKNIIIE